MKPVLAIILIVIVSLNSCSPAKEFTKLKITDFTALNNLLQSRTDKINTFSGSGALTIESPELINSTKFKAFIKKPDSLLVQLKGPFGISVGSLMLTRKNFVFVNNVENKIQRGHTDKRSIESIINLPFDFDDIIYILTGSYPVSFEQFEKYGFEESGSNYIFRSENPERELRINTLNGSITHYRESDAAGNSVFELTADYFEKTGETTTPHFIRIIFPKQKRSLTIAYDDIKLNSPVNCAINIPDNFE